MKRLSLFRSIFGLSMAVSAATLANAQTNSTATSVTLNAVLGQSLSVTASAASYNWPSLTPGGITDAATPVTLTTTWVLSNTASSVELDAYFATPAHAMSDGGSNYIPATAIFGAVSGDDSVSSTALTATTTLGPNNAGLTIFSHTLGSDFNAHRSDVLALSIHLSGITLPAGTYTGTLTFQAQAL